MAKDLILAVVFEIGLDWEFGRSLWKTPSGYRYAAISFPHAHDLVVCSRLLLSISTDPNHSSDTPTYRHDEPDSRYTMNN
jgi:hypothetical protein